MCLVVEQTLGFWKQLVSDILFRDPIQPCSIPGRRRQLPGFKAPKKQGSAMMYSPPLYLVHKAMTIVDYQHLGQLVLDSPAATYV